MRVPMCARVCMRACACACACACVRAWGVSAVCGVCECAYACIADQKYRKTEIEKFHDCQVCV